MADQTEREVLGRLILGYDYSELNLPSRKNELDRERAFRKADDILAAGFHRTPTPHVVTTVEEALQQWHDAQTPGTPLSFDNEEGFEAGWDACMRAISPAPAPVDREALALRMCHSRSGHMTPGTYACDLCRGEVDRVLDAIEGVSRG